MMADKNILALDQGTTSSRSMVFDRKGKCLGSGQQEFPQYFPNPGLVEHDLMEIWDSQLASIKAALRQANLTMRQIAAIGITNQRETIAIWDKRTGAPLARALVWQDKRTASQMHQHSDKREMIHSKTGLLPDPYFSASKLQWLLDHTLEARALAKQGRLAAGTIDTWLIYKLTGGEFLTDIGNAARTLLFNIHSLSWDDELLELFDIPIGILPQVVPSSGICGKTQAAQFGAAVPIAGIAGDQHAALFGQHCWRPGMIKNTYGTGCFVLMNTGNKPAQSKHNLLTTIAWQFPDQEPVYALEGSVFVAGSAIQWLRDGLGLIKTDADINVLASSDNGGVYFVPAFVGLGAPHWDPQARGVLVGITRGTSAGHIAYAVLESIAFQSVELVAAMQQDYEADIDSIRVDGGATASSLLMQIQADLLDLPIEVPHIRETTALGAACLAGLGCAFWQDQEELSMLGGIEHIYRPQISAEERKTRIQHWHRAVERSKKWVSA